MIRLASLHSSQVIDAQAADWVVRLSADSCSENTRKAWQAWISQDPAHELAYNHAQQIWLGLDVLRSDPGPLADDLAAVAKVDSVQRQRWLPWASAAAFCAMVIMFSALWFNTPELNHLMADYRTGIGEQKHITLSDGSDIYLGPATALNVEYNNDERRLVLLTGQAVFHAVPRSVSEPRTFSVAAAKGVSSALGTKFSVSYLAKSVQVTVIEHSVAVILGAEKSSANSLALMPGQAVIYSDKLGDVQTVNINQHLAWQQGRLFFDQVPFAEVVNEINRYQRGAIVISSNSLAERRVSGVFNTNDLPNALAAISNQMGVKSFSLFGVTFLYP